MNQLELQEKHDKIAGSDSYLKFSIEKLRTLSEQELRTEKSKASTAYHKIRRDNLLWTSKPSLLNILAILAYPLTIGALAELLIYGHYKNEIVIILSVLSAGYCIFHYNWARQRKHEEECLLRIMRAADAVLVERGDKVATMMQHIGPSNF